MADAESTDVKLPPETHIGRVALRVGDVDRLADFYRDVVGLAVVERADDRVVLGADGDPLVVLESDPDAPERPADAAGLFHLALLVPDGALGDVLRRVRDRWDLAGASDHLVSEALYLRDPEGNGVEVYRDRPREQWPRSDDGVEMDTLGLDLDELAADAAEEGDDADELPAGTRVGHVHLEVTDLADSWAFYGRLLGMDLMDAFSDEALFLSAGGYHHHVGLNVWRGRTAPAGDHRGLAWFEVVLPDEEAAAAVEERVRDAGVTVSEQSGGGVAVTDPDGIEVRIVAG